MARNELNWDDLRYFLGAVRAGTLAGASRAMKVEHTTIGRRLSSLEELGALLDRGVDFETWSKLLVPRLGDWLHQHMAARAGSAS